MGDVFGASGYRTGLFGKWHLGDSYPYLPQNRGFQEVVHHKSWGVTSAADYWGNDYFDDTYYHNGKLQKYEGYCNDVWFREAMKWMRTCAAQGEPFFCYLPTNVPHGPALVAPEYAAPYKKPGVPANFFGMIANLDENMGKLMAMLDETGLADNTILIFMTDNGGTGGVRRSTPHAGQQDLALRRRPSRAVLHSLARRQAARSRRYRRVDLPDLLRH
jgi:arylsulfatase A-like enzyme